MNQSEIIEYVTARGANVVLRKFGASQDSETICVLVGSIPVESSTDIQGWEHSIYLDELVGGWSIGFSQFGTTRSLDDVELKKLLDLWIKKPDYKAFRAYEPS
ncbi:hypothetical protein [Gimesia aquarii]|uniref:Uncharacterized protein n=1 Tax=Gimesia aquarii TaxID=2527964 RepID=A0A517VNQ2_9PLAN|nr:hypothetical protein [Gimesia aquarii]QDT94638.1 hypothetical protein V144x_00680 [Gimesia aquarii]